MRRVMTMVLLGAVLGCAPAAHAQQDDGRTVWLCRPDAIPNPCHEDPTTTVQEPDGSSRVVAGSYPAEPPVDCFYVYPTVSNQYGPNATRTAEPEVQSIARYQAARFSEQCKVYAPVYRQGTVISIFNGGFTDASREIAYGDVLQAFKEYLATDNQGRGIVLLGHSQGTGVLRRLVREQVDPDPALRKRLVSAVLLGGNVTVKQGSDRGGDFANVPVCREDGQPGCVIAFSTFNAPPPDDTRFGKPPAGTDRLTGQPFAPGREVACVNPASISANRESAFETLVPTQPFAPGLIAAGILALYGGAPPQAATPWVQPADRYAGRCERVNGAHVLLVHGLGNARTLTPFPDDTWGLHLVDVNGALGDLQRAVAAQTASWQRARLPAPRVRVRAACRAGRHRITATGANLDRLQVGRRSDTVRPFALTTSGRAARITARVTLKDGRTATRRLRVRAC